MLIGGGTVGLLCPLILAFRVSSNQVVVAFLLGGCIIHRRCVDNILF